MNNMQWYPYYPNQMYPNYYYNLPTAQRHDPTQNYSRQITEAEALRLAIINWSHFLNAIAFDQQLANEVVSLIQTGNTERLNVIMKELGLEENCYYNNGVCCNVGGRTVCMNITIR
ncbi:hypothetical protein BKP45_07765 [Anaerobacillus alkalidiazotrophicus]|uniref:Uncharacterized protein n=1 Tax=Anaerobacillus alkalidiazotrophicus TaxID=472963 RepID=A0A1S2M8H3_9BACI|nr:hypothetical protein [Anaerobacillus alkalidiazotrophicus]OIJ20896.1 hypothetical protein BKP45_07765 [Anaerobacillus alkalidiazotrophicus]